MVNNKLSSADYIREQIPGIVPQVGIILGSGLGDLVDDIESRQSLSYQTIPGFPPPRVAGHGGQLHLGRLGKVVVACLQGRSHFYEGTSNEIILNMVHTLHELGCQYLIVTNAAGSLHTTMLPGELMLITDHINFQFRNVLTGHFYDNQRSPFIDMEHAYCPELQQAIRNIAAAQAIKLNEGVYVGVLGPSFETPAEIKAFACLGADAVGMSTIAEITAAHYYGLRSIGISVISNFAAGLSAEKLSHEHTLHHAKLAGDTLKKLIHAFLQQYHFSQ